MPATNKFPFRTFLLLTAAPALIVGAALWYLSGLLPSCAVSEKARLPSPDAQFDLVVFSRDCGTTTGANTQGALIPVGEAVPDDAASFVSVGAAADFAPRWDGFGNIDLTLPAGAEVYRQDATVAGISVIYR